MPACVGGAAVLDRRAPAGRRARAGRPRGAAGAPRAAARSPRPAGGGRRPRRARGRRTRSLTAAAAGTARIRPPSSRRLFTPSRRPSASTSGPPDEPRGSGAVCSMAPWMRRPRGPRKLRPPEETKPSVARRPRPPGLASATTGAPMRGPRPPAPSSTRARRRCRPRARRGRGRGRRPRRSPVSRRPSAKRDRHLVAAEVVRVGQHVAVGDHDAGAAAPAAAEADDGGPDPLRAPRRWRPEESSLRSCDVHGRAPCESLATCKCTIHRLRFRPWQSQRPPRSPPRSTASATAGRCCSWRRSSTAPRRFGDLQERLPRHRAQRAHPAAAPARGRGAGGGPALLASARRGSSTS